MIDPVLKKFAREVGKTVFFGIRSEDAIVYIRKFEPENPIITTATVGTKNPVYCTSLGRLFWLTRRRRSSRRYLTGCIKKFTERTIDSLPALEKELEQVRERGYALDARELEEHMECVGAPVFGPDGGVMGAISLSSLYKPTEIMRLWDIWLGKRLWSCPVFSVFWKCDVKTGVFL